MKTKINVIILILAATLCLIACVEEEIRPSAPSGPTQSVVTFKPNNVAIK
jgi:hypothetical protein